MKGEGIPRIPAGAAWMLPLLLAVTVAGVGLWADSVARSVVESRVRDQLRLALDANARAVDLWMESQEAMVRLVAENPRVQAFAGEIVAASHKPGLTDDALRTGPEQLEFRSLVMSAGLSRGQGGGSLEGVVGVALAEPAGRILAALHPARVGIRHEAFADEAILRVLGGEALVLHPQRTTQRRGVGDGSGTPPSSWPLGRVVTGAVAGQPGVDTQGYRDYRGVNVVGPGPGSTGTRSASSPSSTAPRPTRRSPSFAAPSGRCSPSSPCVPWASPPTREWPAAWAATFGRQGSSDTTRSRRRSEKGAWARSTGRATRCFGDPPPSS